MELTSRQILLLLFGLSVVAVAPLALTPYPSLDDYFHHLARAHILREEAGGALARYYTIEWEILPNLAIDLIVPPLAALVGLEAAGRLFVGLSLVLLASGTMALYAALHGRLAWWPLLAFLLLWNRVFLYGFVNYIFTLGLALWALAAWVHWRGRPVAFRLPVFAAIATILFVGHLFALGVYGLAVLGYEIARWWEDAASRPLWARDLAVMLGQFALPAILLLVTSPTGDYVTAVNYVEEYLRHKVRGFHHLFLNYHVWFDRLTFVVLALAVLLGLLTRRIVVHRRMWPVLALFLATYLVMPDTLFDAGAADYRLPVAVGLLFFAATTPQRLPWPRLIAAALLGLFVVRMGLIAERYVAFDRVYRESVEAIRASLPEGAAMITLTARMPDYHREFHQPQLMYLSGLAIIEKAAFDPSFATFAHPGKQPVRLQPEHRRLVTELDRQLAGVDDIRRLTRTPPLELILPDDENGPSDLLAAFDYALLLYAGDGDNPAPDRLEEVHLGPRFQLYRVRAMAEDAPQPGLAQESRR